MDLETYRSTGRLTYSALADAIAAILAAAIAQRGDLRLQQIQKRAKSPESLLRKLEDRGEPATDDIEGVVKDLAGVRVVLYTNSDVDRLIGSRVIAENFEID